MDKSYLGQNYRVSELEHHYGPRVHLLSDPFLFTLLARLCTPELKQPAFNELVRILYQGLAHAVMSHEFPRKPARVATRMAARHPEAHFTAELIDREQQVVTVDLARAGTYPSHVCYELLNQLMNPDQVRQDHVLMSRVTNERQQVMGASSGGCKIGGGIANSILLFPDPMGATGSTIVEVLDLYKTGFHGSLPPGRARKLIAMHLIVTPEYLKNVLKRHSDLIIYALRLDRGLSPPEILTTRPGEKWDQEKGLNGEQYIVPGAGGFGELLNNAYV